MTASRPQRIVFLGTAEFAVPSLEALVAARHDVLAVVTQPDKPQGRGGKLLPSPVKVAAERLGAPILQPKRIRSEKFQESLRAMAPDVLAVAAYGQIVPQSLLDLPRLAPINVHGSLLPKYRGAAPIQRAIMNGEAETGVTTMWMDATLDTGDILLKEALEIGAEDTAGTLIPKLAAIGAKLLLETIDGLENGTLNRAPQDEHLATLAPMLVAEDGIIDWAQSARQVSGRVRGVNPKPGAFAEINGRRVKVWMAAETEDTTGDAPPGSVFRFSKNPAGLLVACGDGMAVSLREVQPENGKRMPALDWARGARIQIGDRFTVATL